MKKRYNFLPENWLPLGFAVAFASFSLTLQAQNGPAKQWDRTFGGSGSDALITLNQTADGGYISGGFSLSGISGDKSQPNQGSMDYWIVKLDPTGNKLWDKSFGGSATDPLRSVVQTSDGGYLVGGYSSSNISSDKTDNSKGLDDYWIIKLDASGNKLWDKTIGGNNFEILNCLIQTPDGGYLLGGFSSSNISGDKTQNAKGSYDYWIVKLDASGNKIWDRTIGGNGDDELFNLAATSDGGFILGGISNSIISGDKTQASKGDFDYWIVKVDASGNKLWDKTIGGDLYDEMRALLQTPDGGYILGGHSNSNISGDKTQPTNGWEDYWVVRLDASGNKIWDTTIGGSIREWLYSLTQTPDGNFILGGRSNSGISGNKTQASKGDFDYWVVKINTSGNKLWEKVIGGNNFDAIYSLNQTADGGFIMGGNSGSDISGDKTQNSKGFDDFWVVKLAPEVLGVKEGKTDFNLSISPNPNQGKFNVQLSDLTSAKAKVTISDLLGRVVFQQEFKTANNQLSEEINLPNAKGIYLLQLKTGEQIIIRKIVVE